jgi:SAM-dependent methyltransferase
MKKTAIAPKMICPGCAGGKFSGRYQVAGQPVILNYRFQDARAASRVPRRDLALVQCRNCGLVFNAAFDPSVVPYDENYDNRQNYSTAYQRHLNTLARMLAAKFRRHGDGRILEVGCGKGDFLRLVHRLTKARCVGYDTTYEPGPDPESRGLSFHRSYVTAADITTRYDVVVCRHVVEHVPAIGMFLRELRDIAAAAGDPVVVLETPRFDWIARHLSCWDVFYEHCNYFPERTLAHLCRLAKFEVIRQRPVFGRQYQTLELKVAKAWRRPRAPGIAEGARLADFARGVRRRMQRLRREIARDCGGSSWAIWGAGAKGVALANLLTDMPPQWVVDSNPAKQGGVLPGTRIPIVGPEDTGWIRTGLVLIVNPNYEGEIRAVLKRRAFQGRIRALR